MSVISNSIIPSYSCEDHWKAYGILIFRTSLLKRWGCFLLCNTGWHGAAEAQIKVMAQHPSYTKGSLRHFSFFWLPLQNGIWLSGAEHWFQVLCLDPSRRNGISQLPLMIWSYSSLCCLCETIKSVLFRHGKVLACHCIQQLEMLSRWSFFW